METNINILIDALLYVVYFILMGAPLVILALHLGDMYSDWRESRRNDERHD